MNEELRKTLRDLPDKPGCYLMRDRNSRIIYVGKASSLRRRVQSYFRPSTIARAEPKLRSLIHSVHSLDVLVVRNEAEALLTEGQLIKEYKPRYNVLFRDDKRYLAIRAEQQLDWPRFTACRIIRDDGNEYFGPFPSGEVVRTAKDFVEKRFGIRKCTVRIPDEETYRHCHNDIIAFCSAPCVGRISKEAYREAFEEACAFLRGQRLDVLEELRQKMHEAAEALQYEKAAELRDTLRALQQVVQQRARVRTPPRIQRETARQGLEEIATILGLPSPPHIIEGFDISHLGGSHTTAGMVVCADGVPVRSRYRHFRIRTVPGIDDPRSIAEVVRRRYARVLEEKQPLPDLILIDGGITQLRAARDALQELGLKIPSVGLAEKVEELVLDNGSPPVLLPRDSPALMMLVRLRDEAHRFAVDYNRNLRAKAIRESALDEIAGIGPKRKQRLLEQFGSVRRIALAPVDEIAQAGLGQELAATVRNTLRRTLRITD